MDEAVRRIMDTVDMPDRLAKDLIMFVQQNHGVLPKRGRSHEFSKLTDDEVAALEAVIRETFEHFENDNKALDHVTSSEA
jgi:hypothetical protein